MATVEAPPGAVWDVLADFGALSGWVPEVEHSCLLRGVPGPGAVRRVQVGRATILETVTAWSAPDHLGYDIAGLPAAIREARNDWWLRGAGASTEVTVTTTVDAGPRPPQRLLARLVASRIATTSDRMLAGLTATLTSGDHARA